MKLLIQHRNLIATIFYTLIIFSCSKSGGGGTPVPANPCAGITIAVTGTSTNPSTASGTNGSITASATGGTGFVFNINGGAFQPTGTFINLAAGSYTITAKNAEGCSGSTFFTLTAPNVCTGITITVSNTVVNNIPCETANSGSVTAAASGGSGGFTYNINGGAFQASNVFANLAAGNYTIIAKDANGCTGASSLTTVNIATPGILFAAVKTLVQNNCVSCHNNTVQNGGVNWTIDCNIVILKDRIKARAVDGSPSPMPQGGLLPVSERQKITDWINGGGKFIN